MSEPTDQIKIDALKFMTGFKINPAVAGNNDIRYKIDETYGLPDIHESPKEEFSQLDIAGKRKAPGRVAIKTSCRMVDIRLSTLPTISGEKSVFRILDRNS